MKTGPASLIVRLTASVVVVTLAGAFLASTPASAEATASDPPDGPSGLTGPIAPVAESVTWDEEGDSPGDDDQLGKFGGPSAYSTNDYTWERMNLTYAIEAWTPDLTTGQTSAAIAGALNTWASVTPLTFTAVAPCGLPFNHASCTSPDIRIVFGAGDHGGGSGDPDFDGVGGVVGHAYGPVPDAWNFTAGGDVHLDDAETWRVDGGGLDLETVALHETGHALGLGHTNQSCAGAAGPSRPIMCSVLTGTQRVLSGDDIAGIQALYGSAPVDLPDGVSTEIIAGGNRSAGTLKDYIVRSTNGYDDDLENASLDVTGVSGCDRSDMTVPANGFVDTVCTIKLADYLAGLDTSASLSMTATLSAPGVSDAVVGPVAITVVPSDHRFWDVPVWVDTAVDWIAYWGLADGYPDGSYRPNNPITRAQVTRMMWRHDGSPGAGPHRFWDVPPWVTGAVNWASTGGLMTGFPDGSFRPNASMTRAEVVRLMYRYAGSPSVAGMSHHGFSDVPGWVQDAVTWAAHDPDGAGPLQSVISGYPDRTFRPHAQITRAQLTRALYRLTDQLVD